MRGPRTPDVRQNTRMGPGLFTLKRQSRRKVTSGARAVTGALPTSVTFSNVFEFFSLTCQLRVKGPLTTGCLDYVRYDNAANVVNKFSVPGDISLARKVRRKTSLNNAAQLSE